MTEFKFDDRELLKESWLEEKLDKVLSLVDGDLNSVKWRTMNGRDLTLGTMSNDHVANCLYYHKHMACVARVAPELRLDMKECLFIEFLMNVLIRNRAAAGTWDIDDYRMN